MEYHGEEALGLIETIGMVPAIQAADSMLKAGNVRLVSYENIGSTLVTVMVKGDVAAVRSSVEAGAAAAAAIGVVTAHNVMARPIKPISKIVMAHSVNDYEPAEMDALGFIETFGLVYVMEAADAMGKAADVELIGYENVASGYISVLVRGDAAAVKTAVEAGVAAVNAMDAEVYSANVIPNPHPDIEKIIGRYSL